MGNHLSSKRKCTTLLSSIESMCKVDDKYLLCFHSRLQTRTNQVISSFAVEDDVRSISFESLKQVIECLQDINQEVERVISDYKQDIFSDKEMGNLVGDYFDNSLLTLNFCTELGKCLQRARDRHESTLVTLRQFEEEDNRYLKTVEELKNFKAAGEPFTNELIQIYQNVYSRHMDMFDKLTLRLENLDKKLKLCRAWRIFSGTIFVAICSVVVICSIVVTTVVAPPFVAAIAAAGPLSFVELGVLIDSHFKNKANAVEEEKEFLLKMRGASSTVIQELKTIWKLVDRLESEIKSILENADLPSKEEAVKVGIEEIKKKLEGWLESVKDLMAQADKCSKDIHRTRDVVLQKIKNQPS